nr:unnamed protein product [Callosobruchus chinensis]
MENGFPMVSQKTELLPGSEKACQHAKQEKERRKHAVGIVAMESEKNELLATSAILVQISLTMDCFVKIMLIKHTAYNLLFIRILEE